MNRWVAIGISAVTLVAAVALFFTGHMVPAAIALAFSVVCDIVFALASRQANAQRKTP
jgi:CHASE2 domain-containing sensor protein